MSKIIPVILMIVALVAAAAGCTPKSTESSMDFDEMIWGGQSNLTADQHIQVGLGLAAKNKSEMALMHFTRAQKKAPENMDVRVYKGDTFLDQGASEAALSEYRTVLEKLPDHAGANQGAGIVYYLAGLEKEAENHLRRAIEVNPSQWKAHCYLGVLLDRQGKADQASEHFRQALALSSGSDAASVLNNLGVTHMARRDYAGAADMFRKALEQGGSSRRTYNNLGLALARMGKYEQALEAFRYGGDEATAHNNLGYVLLMDGRSREAVNHFEQAVELSPTFYEKAFANLKRARMAAASGHEQAGSTPNPPLASSHGTGQRVIAEAAALPAAAQALTPDTQSASLSAPAAPSAAPQARTASAPHTPEQGDTNTSDGEDTFGLHVSSWRDREDAARHGQKLSSMGYETFITKVDLGEKGTWHRVLVGSYPSIGDAVKARPEVLEELDLKQASVYSRTQTR